MKVVEMREAETTQLQLVEQVEDGEKVLVTRAGRPVARIVAARNTGRRVRGQWKGRVRMSDDFDAPLPDAELAPWLGAP